MKDAFRSGLENGFWTAAAVAIAGAVLYLFTGHAHGQSLEPVASGGGLSAAWLVGIGFLAVGGAVVVHFVGKRLTPEQKSEMASDVHTKLADAEATIVKMAHELAKHIQSKAIALPAAAAPSGAVASPSVMAAPAMSASAAPAGGGGNLAGTMIGDKGPELVTLTASGPVPVDLAAMLEPPAAFVLPSIPAHAASPVAPAAPTR